MAKQDKIIEEIGEMLSKGATRGNAMSVIVNKWQVSDRTFDRHWKKANEKARQARQVIDDAINDTIQGETLEALKAGLKSDLELEVILCQIATDNVQVEDWINGIKVLRGISPGEIVAAVRELWKKRGSYAPVKNALTNKDGDDIKNFEVTLKL